MTGKPPETGDSDAPRSGDAGSGASGRRSTCPCGHDRDHFMVSAECKYTGWGWFWVTVIGASARPVRAVFRCRECGQVVEETDDPDTLRTLV